MNNSNTLERLRIQKHEALKDLLKQCTEPQIQLFNRMYRSVDTISEDKIDWAIQQCERTIQSNNVKDL